MSIPKYGGIYFNELYFIYTTNFEMSVIESKAKHITVKEAIVLESIPPELVPWEKIDT